MKIINRLFLLSIIASTLICGLVYGIYFDDLSETSMVQLSYFWIFFLVMGIAGLALKKNKRQILIALIWGLFALVLLWFFFERIFPML